MSVIKRNFILRSQPVRILCRSFANIRVWRRGFGSFCEFSSACNMYTISSRNCELNFLLCCCCFQGGDSLEQKLRNVRPIIYTKIQSRIKFINYGLRHIVENYKVFKPTRSVTVADVCESVIFKPHIVQMGSLSSISNFSIRILSEYRFPPPRNHGYLIGQ